MEIFKCFNFRFQHIICWIFENPKMDLKLYFFSLCVLTNTWEVPPAVVTTRWPFCQRLRWRTSCHPWSRPHSSRCPCGLSVCLARIHRWDRRWGVDPQPPPPIDCHRGRSKHCGHWKKGFFDYRYGATGCGFPGVKALPDLVFFAIGKLDAFQPFENAPHYCTSRFG